MSRIKAAKALLVLEMRAAKERGESISPETMPAMLVHIRETLPDITDVEILAAARALKDLTPAPGGGFLLSVGVR